MNCLFLSRAAPRALNTGLRATTRCTPSFHPIPKRTFASASLPEQPRLRLGSSAPNFQCKTTHGDMDFHKFIEGSWAILFSHPADFTPVCTTELGAFAKMKGEFDKRGVKMVGLVRCLFMLNSPRRTRVKVGSPGVC